MAPTPHKKIGFRKHERHFPDFGDEHRCVIPDKRYSYRPENGQKQKRVVMVRKQRDATCSSIRRKHGGG